MAISDGDAAYIFFTGVVLLFAVIGNFMVIYIVCRNKKMRNVTNVLICNLSVSDIMLAGIMLPQQLHDLSHDEDFYEGEFLCKTVYALPIMCITTASYTLAVMSFERRNCIVNSFSTQVTVKHCKIIIPIVWVIAMLSATPTVIEFNVSTDTKVDGNITETILVCDSKYVPRAFVISNGFIILVVTYVVPLCIILYNYSIIVHYVFHQKDLEGGQSTAASVAKTTILKKRLKIIKMLVIVAAVFAVSWIPYFVTLIIGKITGTNGSENIATWLSLLQISLAAFSTSYNVVLYITFNPMFRDAFKLMLRCPKGNKVESADSFEQQTNVLQPSTGVTAVDRIKSEDKISTIVV